MPGMQPEPDSRLLQLERSTALALFAGKPILTMPTVQVKSGFAMMMPQRPMKVVVTNVKPLPKLKSNQKENKPAQLNKQG